MSWLSRGCMIIKGLQQRSKCKICDGNAQLHGVLDFNTSCLSTLPDHAVLPLTGVPIYYHRCENCGLIYTHAFDDWTFDDFKTHIYNDEYVLHDPDFTGARSKSNLELIMSNFEAIKEWRVLDYGGGDGQLAQLLCAEGVDAVGWDPFHLNNHLPTGKFELIVCFEVFEHTPTPVETLMAACDYLKENEGAIFFSTLVNDSTTREGMNHWYIAPRNGHITIHTKQSLDILFRKVGLEVIHFSDSFHMGYNPAGIGN
ncbi:class I SAM-dependent methyltransferase [Kluyvera sp. Nf5]|nr:class I SAM-dependent methyltransferase [Kluyvera sp. Nf5]